MAQNYDDLYKSKKCNQLVILAGDAYVGKTNLVYRYVKNNSENTKNIAPTVGVQFSSKMVRLADGKRIKAQIWDTAGQQQYRSITAAHYRKALGALVVYDITKYQSFQNVKKWIQGIKQHASANVVIVMVGNKLDLKKNSEQVVSTNDGKKMASSLGVLFSQTSALTNENVETTFTMMLECTQYFTQRQRKERSNRQLHQMQKVFNCLGQRLAKVKSVADYVQYIQILFAQVINHFDQLKLPHLIEVSSISNE